VATDVLSIVLLCLLWTVATDRCVFDVATTKPLCGEHANAVWLDVAVSGNRIVSLKGLVINGGLGIPIVALWVYGLAVGEGATTKVLSRPLLADRLSPLCFGVYLIHFPLAWCWFWIFHGYEFRPWYRWISHRTLPFAAWELPPFLAICFAGSWAVNEYVVAPWMPRALRLTRVLMHTALRLCRIRVPETSEGGDTLQIVLVELRRLTGTSVRPDTSLATTGLDSFGASALLGVLRSSFPQASSLRPASLSELGTVAALASFLEQGPQPSTTSDGTGDRVKTTKLL